MLENLIHQIAAVPDSALVLGGLCVLTLAVLVLWTTALRAMKREHARSREVADLRAKIAELNPEPPSRSDMPSEALAAAVYHRVNTVYYHRQLKELGHAFGQHGYAVRPAGARHALTFTDLPIATRESIARDFGLARTRLLEPHTEADTDLLLRVERDTKRGFYELLISDYCQAMFAEGLALYPLDPVRHDYDTTVDHYSRLLDESSLVLHDEGEPLTAT